MKTILISLTLLTGFFTVASDYLVYLKPKGNSISLGSQSVVHSSDNCKVESYSVYNSKFYNGSVYVLTIYKNKMNFKVTNKNYTDNNFYVNSNFFGHRGEPLGECVVDGKRISRKNSGGGYFTSNGGNGSVTTYGRSQSKYISQTGYVAIRNGKINNSYNRSGWGRLQTHRVMIGENKKGDIIVIHTNSAAEVTIPMMNQIAIKSGVYSAIHLDGGPSVEVKLKDGFYNHEFNALSKVIKKASNIPIPPVHIVGNFRN
jgi:hypothetical protein